MYYAKQFEKEKSNVKNTWKIINSVLRNKTPSKLSSIDVNGAVINNSHVMANHFNTCFTNIGDNLRNQIPPIVGLRPTSYHSILKKNNFVIQQASNSSPSGYLYIDDNRIPRTDCIIYNIPYTIYTILYYIHLLETTC